MVAARQVGGNFLRSVTLAHQLVRLSSSGTDEGTAPNCRTNDLQSPSAAGMPWTTAEELHRACTITRLLSRNASHWRGRS